MSRIYGQVIDQKMLMKSTTDNVFTLRNYFIAMLIIAIFPVITVFKGLWDLWHCDKNFDGLFLVPILCAYILYKRKNEFIQCGPKSARYLLFLLPAVLAAMYFISIYDFPRIGGYLLIMGLIMAFWGTLGYSNVKLFIGPLLFLALMVPPPQPAVDFITVNLQKFFSALMEMVMFNFSDRFIESNGFQFLFSGIDYPMIIAPECSGFRSLIGLFIISSFMAIFDRQSILASVLMIFVGVMLSLLLNFMRIFTTMQLRLNGLEEYSKGMWHGLLGIAVFLAGIMILSKLSRIIKPVTFNRDEESK